MIIHRERIAKVWFALFTLQLRSSVCINGACVYASRLDERPTFHNRAITIETAAFDRMIKTNCLIREPCRAHPLTRARAETSPSTFTVGWKEHLAEPLRRKIIRAACQARGVVWHVVKRAAQLPPRILPSFRGKVGGSLLHRRASSSAEKRGPRGEDLETTSITTLLLLVEFRLQFFSPQPRIRRMDVICGACVCTSNRLESSSPMYVHCRAWINWHLVQFRRLILLFRPALCILRLIFNCDQTLCWISSEAGNRSCVTFENFYVEVFVFELENFIQVYLNLL